MDSNVVSQPVSFANLINFDKEYSSKVDWTLLFARFNYYLPKDKSIFSLDEFKAFFSIFILSLHQKTISNIAFEEALDKTIYSFNYKHDWRYFSGLTRGYHSEFNHNLFIATYANFEKFSQTQVLLDQLVQFNEKEKTTEIKNTINIFCDSALEPIQATECLFYTV